MGRAFLFVPDDLVAAGLHHQMGMDWEVVGTAYGTKSDATAPVFDVAEKEPDVVVIHLDDSQQGIDFGLGLRVHVPTSEIPVVFVGGARRDADRVQKVLPQAVLSDLEHLREALEMAGPRAQAALEESPWVALRNRDMRLDRDERPLPGFLR